MHQNYGHPKEWPEMNETVKKMREKFVAEDLPRFMGYFTNLLAKFSGPFFAGENVTIADLCIFPQLRYFTRGIADHVPADCLGPYTEIVAWMDAMKAVPQIK